MGYVIKDFECPSCGITEKMVESGVSTLVCCGSKMAYALISAPKVVGADSFNPHFDLTQGHFFSSSDEKKNWLKSKEKEQVDGSLSPRTSGGGRVLCSKEQAVKLKNFNKYKNKISQKDIPCLKQNKRTSVYLSPRPASS